LGGHPIWRRIRTTVGLSDEFAVWLASVIDQVACPLPIAHRLRELLMIEIKRIALPTDFSDPCWTAAQYAFELARRFDAQLDLLHITESTLTAMPSPGSPLPPEVVADTREEAERELRDWHASEFDELPAVTREVIRGVPFVEIVRFAKQHDVDLIVMGTHGRTGLPHLLIGSVAERVVRKSPCPVLTVRPEGHQFIMP
jgi:nucleotide-binding universal stress UspA family protein